MFKKNLEALRINNKTLADKLENMTIQEVQDNIEVYQAESGNIIIAYQGLALDDIYDPIREAKTNWNMNIKKELSRFDIVFIFGLGLGYLFKRAYISCQSRIILYEPQIDILRYVLEYVDFSEQIADNRVFITTDKVEAMNYLAEKYLSNDDLHFLYPQAYSQLLTNEMESLTNDIVEICNLKKMDVNTIMMLAKNWTKHSLANLSNIKKVRPLSWIKDIFQGKTALIAAAGPSLADNIELIKANRNKFIIFAVNRSAQALFANGITPDFVMFSDVVSIKHTVDGILDKLKQTNIIADLRANSYVYTAFDNIFTYFSKNDLIAQNINNVTNNAFNLLETGGTATAQAYYSAKLLGIKNIVFAGLDLAYKGKVAYADGQIADILEDNTIKSGNNKKNLLYVKDLNGNKVLTRDDYALFIRQFEDAFAGDNISNIYNISDFGAYIEGMKYVKLSDIICEFEELNIDVKNETDKLRESTKDRWNDVYKLIYDMLKNEQITLQNISDKTALLLNKEADILNQLKDNPTDAKLFEQLSNLSDEFSSLLPEILADSFLSQYFQSEFVNFINISNQSINQNIEAFMKLKNFEISILNGIVSICNDWLKFLKEKYN